jgi:hypothetical protein
MGKFDNNFERGYSRSYGNYNNNGRANSYNNSNRYSNRPQKKRSGCKSGNYCVNGSDVAIPYINGWNYSKSAGLVSFIAVPCKDFGTKSEHSQKWVLKMTYGDKRKPELFTAFYNTLTRKLTVPDLSMVANPAKDYFGTFIK